MISSWLSLSKQYEQICLGICYIKSHYINLIRTVLFAFIIHQQLSDKLPNDIVFFIFYSIYLYIAHFSYFKQQLRMTTHKKQDMEIFVFDDPQEEDQNPSHDYQLSHSNSYKGSSIIHQNDVPTFRPKNNFVKQNYDQYQDPNDIIIFDEDCNEDQLQFQEQQFRQSQEQNHKQISLVDLKKRILFNDKKNTLQNNIKKPTQQIKQNINSKTNNATYVCGKNDKQNRQDFIKSNHKEDSFLQFQQSKDSKMQVQDNTRMLATSQIKNIQSMIGANIKNNEFAELEYVQQKKSLKVNNMKQFLFTQISTQYKINAIIKKVNSGFIYGTKYAVFIQENNKFLFSVLKDGMNKFIFSFSKQNISDQNKNYLGKMVSNFSGADYILYDDGFDPTQTKSLEFCHRQMAYIKYDDYDGPRKFEAIISTNNNKGFHVIQKDENVINQKWLNKQRKYMSKFYSKKPTYDPMDGNYKLDFKGMAGQPSIKNFILQNEQYSESLIFGRRNKQDFAVQIRCPFSVMQAVAICISSIHYKVFL